MSQSSIKSATTMIVSVLVLLSTTTEDEQTMEKVVQSEIASRAAAVAEIEAAYAACKKEHTGHCDSANLDPRNQCELVRPRGLNLAARITRPEDHAAARGELTHWSNYQLLDHMQQDLAHRAVDNCGQTGGAAVLFVRCSGLSGGDCFKTRMRNDPVCLLDRQPGPERVGTHAQ